MSAHDFGRSTLRKPPKRLHAEKSRRGRGIGILILFDNGSVVNVGEGVAEVTGEAMISIEAHLGTLDLHLHDVEVLPEAIIVALHPGAKSTRTSQAIAAAVDQKVGVADHLLSEDQFQGLPPYLYHHLDADAMKKMGHRDHGAADTLQVDLQLHPAEGLEEARGEEVQIVVMLELDPLHLQKPHAHVPLEATGSEDLLLPSPLVAPPLVPGQGMLGVAADLLHGLHQGHILVR